MGDLDRRRRLGAIIVVIGAVAGGALIVLAKAHETNFRVWLEGDLETRARVVVWVLSAATAGPMLGLSAYVWFVDRRRVPRILAAFLTLASVIVVYFMFRLVSLLS